MGYFLHHGRAKARSASSHRFLAIHVLLAGCLKDVDARDKPGHDKSEFGAVIFPQGAQKGLFRGPV
jgi:hypothetical protein